MMLPGRLASTSTRATRCVHSSTWRRLLLYNASQPFSLVSSNGEENTPPALLTRTDGMPRSVVVRCNAASTCSLSRTSVTMPRPPMASAADVHSPAGYDRHATGEQDVGRIDGHRD